MNENMNPIESLEEIKSYMQKSTRFLSLSGWSGIWVGACGLVSGLLAMYLLREATISPVNYNYYGENFKGEIFYAVKKTLRIKLLILAFFTFLAAVSGGFFFSARKAKKDGVPFVNHVFRRMIVNFSIPLITGGLVCLSFIYHNYIILVAPATLIFYGFALFMVARDTLDEIKTLALLEILLGIVSFFLLKYNMICWIIGFGVLHVVYGIIMRNKYDKHH
jgi:hypothetical protein